MTWKSQLHFDYTKFPGDVLIADPHWVARACELAAICAQPDPLDDEEDAAYAAALLTEAGQLHDIVDDQRTKAKKPFLDAGRQVDSAAKPVLAALDTAMSQLKMKLIEYKQKRDAALAAQLTPGDDGRTPALDFSVAADVKIATRKNPEVKITNPSLIPSDFWIIDIVKLKNALLAGEVIPGAEIVWTESVVRR